MLWDIKAKAWNVPLAQLLGGIARSQVEFSDYFAHRESGENSIDDVVEYCLAGVQVARPAGREQERSFVIFSSIAVWITQDCRPRRRGLDEDVSK
ncbi:hypothetical protein [Rhodococcus sp. APC 3903]|uniref:hypothetical protein n=1 Tax=Rhodococcus sp. APC 3903 TaxID=3035193 RepID=UPI0025B4446E|nr:hypothetical protein [Rhodococcus sp. APC 3903]MDN3460102.1 hypothetical protein [Rhodococcus sp. APC 3903]